MSSSVFPWRDLGRTQPPWLVEQRRPNILALCGLTPVTVAVPRKKFAHAGPHQSAVFSDVQHPGGLLHRVLEVAQEIPGGIAHLDMQVGNPLPHEQTARIEPSPVLQSHQSNGTDSRKLARWRADKVHRLM